MRLIKKKLKISGWILQAEAFYTVEAVFILPILFFIILLLLYFNFYLHDRVCVTAEIHMVADTEEDRENNFYSYEVFTPEEKFTIKTDYLWMAEIENVKQSVHLFRRKIASSISVKLLEGTIPLYSSDYMSFYVEGTGSRVKRTELARLITVGSRLINELKGKLP